ncbi:MAG: hypothetical protein DI551_00525 [Micavibrio aeruginosavorus]|uniref:Lipoprotein n=1 Tax=Micavibrio aeruginosavorus TaxID=349221 RepID=A0A2W5N5S8_9BACT|nr:MAG: hypothetical protein DI551_00525 [Micavibrio aeruginosavorus]
MNKALFCVILLLGLGVGACAQSVRQEAYSFPDFYMSAQYQTYRADEVRKALPADLKNCRGSQNPLDELFSLQDPVRFKTIEVKPGETYVPKFVAPYKGKWLEKRFVQACQLGIEVKAHAVPKKMPQLEISYVRGAHKSSFLKLP